MMIRLKWENFIKIKDRALLSNKQKPLKLKSLLIQLNIQSSQIQTQLLQPITLTLILVHPDFRLIKEISIFNLVISCGSMKREFMTILNRISPGCLQHLQFEILPDKKILGFFLGNVGGPSNLTIMTSFTLFKSLLNSQEINKQFSETFPILS